MIETFRDGIPSVMPEIFNQASTSSVIPKIQSESIFLNNLDPGLKIAGVTKRGESTSLLRKMFFFPQ